MAKNIETLEVAGLSVENYWDSDAELCIDLGTYSAYPNREEVEKLRDHLTTMLGEK